MNRKDTILRVLILQLIILLVVFLFYGCTSKPVLHTDVEPDDFGKKFKPEELRSDLDILFKTLENVHPDPYVYTSKSQIDSLRQNLEHALTTPLTRIEFYFKIAPLIAHFEQGHTSVNAPREEFEHYRSNGGFVFPFDVSYDVISGLTITRNYSSDSTLASGDRIVSINGFQADSLVELFISGYSGEQRGFRQQRATASLRLLLWLNNIRSPFNLTIQHSDTNEQYKSFVAGVTMQNIAHIDSLLQSQHTGLPDYSYKRLYDNVGYINFRSMMGNFNDFYKFLSETFANIHSDSLRGLIVDLRQNGGGKSQLGGELLHFLTDSSYRMDQRKEWKMSAEIKSLMKKRIPAWIRWFPFSWVSSNARRYFGTQDGEIVVDTSKVLSADTNYLRYRGKTCFLIGSRTYSSAVKLADAISFYKLSTLIGEETGGCPTGFGEVYPFDLPNTQLAIGVPSAFFVRANGDATDRRGVIPDIIVHQAIEDTRFGKDTILERATQWILSGK